MTLTAEIYLIVRCLLVAFVIGVLVVGHVRLMQVRRLRRRTRAVFQAEIDRLCECRNALRAGREPVGPQCARVGYWQIAHLAKPLEGIIPDAMPPVPFDLELHPPPDFCQKCDYPMVGLPAVASESGLNGVRCPECGYHHRCAAE